MVGGGVGDFVDGCEGQLASLPKKETVCEGRCGGMGRLGSRSPAYGPSSRPRSASMTRCATSDESVAVIVSPVMVMWGRAFLPGTTEATRLGGFKVVRWVVPVWC